LLFSLDVGLLLVFLNIGRSLSIVLVLVSILGAIFFMFINRLQQLLTLSHEVRMVGVHHDFRVFDLSGLDLLALRHFGIVKFMESVLS